MYIYNFLSSLPLYYMMADCGLKGQSLISGRGRDFSSCNSGS